jgi:AcrR family transcriptional regulator
VLPEAVDLRTKRTHILLRNTLVDLIAEKGFDAVTVRDIAERAMINRATFYRHFQDKYALVAFIFEEVVENVLLEVGPPENNFDIFVNIDVSTHKNSSVKMHHAVGILKRLFEHIAKDQKLYRSLLGKNGSSWFSSQMCDYLAKIWLQRIQSSKLFLNRKTTKQHIISDEMAVASLARLVIGTITWWLENGMHESPEEMAEGCLSFIAYGYYRSLGMNDQNLR